CKRIYLHKQDNLTLIQDQLAKWAKKNFNLDNAPNQTTLLQILGKKNEYLKIDDEKDLRVKWQQTVLQPQLDEELANWVLQCQTRRIYLTGELIYRNTPDFSVSRLLSFEQYYGFKIHRIYGESGSADNKAIERNLSKLRTIISEYTTRDIYNIDEAGLFYRMALDKTIAKRQIEGSKKDKTCLTIAFTSNADGSHILKLFFISYSKKLKSFKVYSNNKDLSVIADLEESLKLLSTRHPMSFAYYTNLLEEMNMVHQEFTNANLLESAASENDRDIDELNNITTFSTILTNQAKLNSLHIVISLLNTTITDHNTTL
ncbi:3908_t:CDS:2, partial [Dentiscutata erythropus]